ncbi:MAG: hypothetical protein M0004_03845 [Actinomycetota bacterium]|nr:hypothetical protein [Actinomycetota bacterium]
MISGLFQKGTLMHPELLRAIARDHDAARLSEARAKDFARSAPSRGHLVTRGVRRYVGSVLVAAGARLLAGSLETAPIAQTRLSASR